MNKIYKLILLQLLLTSVINAQYVEDFNSGTSCITNGCYLGNISPTCLPGWGVSHGTANLSNNSANATFKLATDGNCLMIFNSGDDTNEEGAFVEYPFITGGCYKITFDLATNGASNNSFLKLKATTGMVHAPVICESAPPNTTGEDVTDTGVALNEYSDNDFFDENSSWGSVVLFYSPSETNNQLWFHIDKDGSGQSVIALDNLEIHDLCAPDLCYDEPSIGIPPGEHSAKSFIKTGAGSNQGFIESSSKETTILTAGGYIHFKPNTFIHRPESTNYFHAYIDECEVECPGTPGNLTFKNTSNSIPSDRKIVQYERGYDIIELAGATRNSEEQNLESIQVYPNPAKELVNIQIPFIPESEMTISLLSLDGKTVYRTIKTKNSELIRLDISDLSGGLYLLEFTTRANTFTRKLIVQ